MKLYLLITLFFATTLFSQTKFDEMKKQYDNFKKEEKHDSAIAVAKRINRWAFEIEKDTSIHYAVSFRYIGNCFLEKQVNDSAIFYFNRSLAQLTLQNRKEHPDFANSLFNLGILYYNLSDYKFAESYYKQALEIRKKVLSKKNPNYTASLNSLGSLYQDMGDYKSSEDYYKQALEIRKKVLGKQHPDYVSNLNYLGNLYLKMGEFKSAESYYKQVLEIRKKGLGEQHPDYASTLYNLGILYNKKNDYKLAELYFKQALEIRKKVLGEQHPDYAISLDVLASNYNSLRDFNLAENYCKQVVEYNKKVLGEQHPDYSASIDNLGSIFYNLGDFKSAELYYKQALEIRKKFLGEQHPDYATSIDNLGSIYYNLGDFKSAESYIKQSLEIRKIKLGEQHQVYASSLAFMGAIYHQKGDYKLAEYYLKQALEIQKKLGALDPNYLFSLNNLVRVYCDLGDYNSALLNCNQVIEIRKRVLGDEHPDYALSLYNLGLVYHSMKDYKSAENYHKQALEIRKKVLGEHHPDYIRSLWNLANVYSDMDEYSSAELYYSNCFNIQNFYINSNFELLNDKEKDFFWIKNKEFYETLDLFASIKEKDYPQVTSLSYNANLFTKGKLLEVKISRENDLLEIVGLRDKLSFLRKRLAKSDGGGSDIQYKKMEDEANILDSKLSRLWSDYAQKKKNLSITWNQVQENLSNDEAAIEFVRYKTEEDSLYHYNALIIRKTDVNPILVKLCTENQLKEINSKEGFSSYYPLVWAPLEEYLKNIKTIYYSPVGLLNTVPFSALYPKKGQGELVTFDKKTKQMVTTTELDADFLMNKYTLHQLTSTRYLAMGLKAKSLEKVENSINLVGGVNYDYLPGDKIEINKGTEYASRGANSINPLKYLEATKTEVETINKTLKSNGWETSILEQNDATEENIEKLENQNAKGVLHIATHGFAFEDARGTSATIDHASIKYNLSYNPDPMKRCGLIFAGGNWAWIGSDELTKRNPDAEDGILTAAQVALLNLKKTKLVVLSACETGLGKIEGGEGVFGLKRAFKLAGVEQIIVSLWEVPDKETMELMTLFYDDLAKTQNAIVSFEKAQKTMKKNYPTRPDLWAGFVLVR